MAFDISMDDLVATSFVSGTGVASRPAVIFGMIRRSGRALVSAIATLPILASADTVPPDLRLCARKTG